jgi:hypothetical protein
MASTAKQIHIHSGKEKKKKNTIHLCLHFHIAARAAVAFVILRRMVELGEVVGIASALSVRSSSPKHELTQDILI